MRHWAVVIVVVVVGCSSMVRGQDIQDIVFYDTFESGDTSGWWAPARVGKTGQTTCYDQAGTVIPDCTGTGQDGDIQPGVAWPEPRFVDNSDGTVTDMLTGLVWLKNASCVQFFGGDTTDLNPRSWALAVQGASALSHGYCGLLDGSIPGDWRLPSRFELESLLDLEYYFPALPNGAGTAQWSEGDVFAGVRSSYYWSSTSYANHPSRAWIVSHLHGYVSYDGKTNAYYVWPVRGGQ